MNKYLLALVLALAGCTTTRELTVQDATVVYITIPKALTSGIEPSPIMSEQEYVKLLPHQKEQYLTDYLLELFGIIKKLNDKLLEIEGLSSKHK